MITINDVRSLEETEIKEDIFPSSTVEDTSIVYCTEHEFCTSTERWKDGKMEITKIRGKN